MFSLSAGLWLFWSSLPVHSLFSPGVFASWGLESAFRLMGSNRVFPDWPDDLLCPLDDRFPTPGNVSPLLSGPSGRILFFRAVSTEYPPNKKGRDLSGPDPCRCKDLRRTKLYSAFGASSALGASSVFSGRMTTFTMLPSERIFLAMACTSAAVRARRAGS